MKAVILARGREADFRLLTLSDFRGSRCWSAGSPQPRGLACEISSSSPSMPRHASNGCWSMWRGDGASPSLPCTIPTGSGSDALALLAARAWLAEPFLLLLAHHMLDQGILERLIDRGLRDDLLVLTIDRSESRPDGGDRYKPGAFLCSSAVLDAAEAALAAGEGSLRAVLERVVKGGRAGAVDVTGLPWTAISTREDVARASARLGAMIRLLGRQRGRPRPAQVPRRRVTRI